MDLVKLTDNYNIDLSHCTSLTLISSESCNLNCSYCLLANSINRKAHLEEAEKVKESFINGSFFNNVQTIIKKYNIIPENIIEMDLWGQEPTLTLNEFSIAFKDFYEYLPNLNKLFFSTNGVAFPDRIINLAKTLDSIVNKDFYLEIQFSYDGYDATKNLRGINPEIIKNNVAKIITELNQINLTYLHILFNFHNVVNADMINYYGFNNEHDDEFLQFLTEIHITGIELSSLNTNDKIHVEKHFSPGLINPYNATAQEGKNLTNFILKANKIGKHLENKWWKGLLYQMNEYIPTNPERDIGLNLYPLMLEQGSDFLKSCHYMTGCGYGYSNLKIRYDGTAVHCQNAIPMLNPKEYLDKAGAGFEINRAIVERNYYPNLLKSYDNLAIEKFFERASIARTGAFSFYLTEVLNLLILLANSNQIDSSYKTDYNKLFRHAIILSQMFICWDNSLTQTGSGFGIITGEMRFMCNGFLDLVDSVRDEFILKFRTGEYND